MREKAPFIKNTEGPIKLLRTPSPNSQESPPGFLLRVTGENGYQNVRWVLTKAGISPACSLSSLLWDHDRFSNKLGEMLGTSGARLKNFVHEADFFKDCGISRAFFHGGEKTKICPQCLADNAYQRKAWDLVPMTACPEHGTLLVDMCECGRVISYDREDILHCRCGLDLRTIASKSLPPDELQPSILIENKLYLTNDAPLPLPLGAMSLGDTLHLLGLIAELQREPMSHRGKRLTFSNNEQVHQAFGRAFNVFVNWPYQFFKFLDDLGTARCSVTGKTGVQASFGPFYAFLAGKTNDQTFTELIAKFSEYLQDRFLFGYVNTKLKVIRESRTAHIITKRTYTKSEAAEFLGVNTYQVGDMIDHGLLRATVKKVKGKTLTLVEIDSAQAMKTRFDQSYSLREAATLLGINHRQMRKFAEAGYVEVLRGPTKDGSAIWRFPQDSVKQFLSELDGLSHPIEKVNKFPMVPLTNALRQLTAAGFSAQKVVGMILRKEVQCFFDSRERGLNRYHLLVDDVRHLCADSNLRRKGDSLTVEDSAMALGVKEHVVRFWIEAGFIRTDGSFLPINRRGRSYKRIPKDAIREFEKKYITATELAERHWTSPRAIVQKMIESHIRPVTGPIVDNGPQYLFLRDSADNYEPLEIQLFAPVA